MFVGRNGLSTQLIFFIDNYYSERWLWKFNRNGEKEEKEECVPY
jgi:hypothetical protein